MDTPFVDVRQLRIIDELGVKLEPLGILARKRMPECDELHQFSGLITADQIGVGVA